MPPNSRDAGYLWDMLQAARRLQEFTAGVSFKKNKSRNNWINMAVKKSFDYDKFDSATQDFLRSKLSHIKLLMKPGFKDDSTVLYEIGKQLSEVRDKLVKGHFLSWLDNEFLNLEEFGRRNINRGTAYDYMKLYNYVSEFLENADCLNANLTAPSVLYQLGKKNVSNSIKQKFAARINSGDKILEKEVEEAIDREGPEKVKEGNLNNDLKLSTYSSHSHNLEIAIIKLKELLKNKERKESRYQELLKDYPQLLENKYQLIERHENLDEQNIPDFTCVRFRDKQRDIIEIKSPFITLFRKNGKFSHKFNEAWNRVEEYLDFVRRNQDYL
jgi:hypothetical protein